MRESLYKCSICGKFISYSDIEKDLITVDFTPDTEYTIEKTVMTHKLCKNENTNSNK